MPNTGRQPSDMQLDTWSTTFLPDPAPYFIRADRVDELLKCGIIVYSRSEFTENFPRFPVHHGLTYDFWEVPQDVHVILMRDVMLHGLGSELVQAIQEDQVRLSNGQVYTEEWVRGLDATAHAILYPHFFYSDGQRYVMLTGERWTSLTPETQRIWLRQWLLDRGEPAVTVAYGTLPLPDSHREIIAAFQGRFPDEGGPNCFAAALGAASGSLALARNIFGLWLHSAPFLRSLSAFGYREQSSFTDADKTPALEPTDVLVWWDSLGRPVHAAFCVSATAIFQKTGQFREQPWTVVPLNSMIDYAGVLTDGGRVNVYRQSST